MLLELSARLFLFGPAGLDLRRVPVTRGLTPPGVVRKSTEPGIGLEFVSNVDVFSNLVRFRTNSRGLRDKEYSLAKPERTFRVAVLGSSLTVPAGVAIEDAFHSLLEERLSAEFAPTSYEFINFAVGFTFPRRVLAMLRLRALEYDPDLVLVAVTRASARLFLQDSNAEFGGNGRAPGEIRMTIAPTGPRSYFVRLLQMRLGQPEPIPRAAIPGEEAVASERDVVAEFGALSRESGIPIVVVRLEYDPNAPTRMDDALARRVAEEGMYYVDTREAFRGTRPEDFWVFKLDRHPNQRAHAIFAHVLEDFLRRQGLLANSAPDALMHR